MKNILLLLTLSLIPLSSNAVSVFPNKITVAGAQGTKSGIQFKVYGHFETANIEVAKVIDLRDNNDKMITEFILGKDQERIIPIDIVIKENTKYYLCAVLKDSQSMRLRTCSSVIVKVTQ